MKVFFLINEKLIKYIEAKIKERNKAKENKDYLLADSIREELGLLSNYTIYL